MFKRFLMTALLALAAPVAVGPSLIQMGRSAWLGRQAKAFFFFVLCGLSTASFAQSAVNLTATPNQYELSVGDTVTLTATVSGNNPTGIVTFYMQEFYGVDPTILDTAPLSAGVATLSKVFTAGTKNITAVYSGDANNASATSPVARLSVWKKPTVTNLTVSPTAVQVGQALTVTATVTGDHPTGSVVFYLGIENKSYAVTAPLANGQAILTAPSYATATVGTQSVQAFYMTDAVNETSMSQWIPYTVSAPSGNAVPTVSIATPSNNASFVGPASIAVTAAAHDADGTIAKVEYFNGSTLLATVTAAPYAYTWNVAWGTASIMAVATDDQGASAASAPVTVTVTPNTAPTVSLTGPANGASYIAPAAVTLNATATDSDGSIAKVEFYNGTTLLGTVTQAPYTFNWTNVAAGGYVITAKATDNLGGLTTSAASSITVSTDQAPTVGLTTPVNNASYILPATISLAASATDSDGSIAKVEFYNGAALLATVTQAPYTFNWTNAAVGTYAITAKATDNLGLVTTSAPVNITVANNALPSVSLTAPLNGASYIAPAAVTLSATAADTDGSIAKVEFYNGATLLGTITQAPYMFNWPNVAAGSYAITAKATDNLGGVITSAASSITVTDNQAPTVSLVAPTDGASYIAPAVVTLNATATDGDGSITKVEFYNGAALLATVTQAPYTFSWTNAAAGSYAITAKATDNLGLVTTSAPVNVTVVNNQLPTISLTAPANGASYIAPAAVALGAAASDTDGSIAKVEFYNGATLLATVTQAPYTFNWANVAAGNYVITAKATDNLSGATTSAASNITVTANQAPTVALTAPANNASYILPATISLTATASDADGSIAKVEFYHGATLLATITQAPYVFEWTNAAAGSYAITAKATDNLGLVTTSAPVNITVANNALPSVSLTTPVNGASYIAPASVPLSATAADTDGSIAKVEFYNGATLLGTITQVPYTFNWTNVAAGSYAITVKATDNLGGVITSASSSITITDNQAPTVGLTAPANNASYILPVAISLAATASDADGSIAKVEFYNGAALLATVTQAPYTFSWTNAAAGSYAITAKATDNLGLVTTSAPVNITVANNALPSVSLTAPANGASYIAPAAATLSATATDSDGSIAKVEFYNGATLLGTVTQAPYTFNWTNVAAGSYAITAKATDNLGGVSTSAASSITVTDNQAPTVGLATPTNGASYIAPAAVTLSATATDTDGSIAKVEFYNGAALLATVTQAPYTFNWTNVAAGSYTITAKATDNLGGVTTSAASSITVSANQAPTIGLTAPANNASYILPATISLAATASDADGSIAKVEFYNDATLLATVTQAPYTFDWTNATAGSYAITAKATDNLGLVTTSPPVSITVANNQLPAISLAAPVNGASYIAPAAVTLTATATDSDGSIAKVEFYNGATLLGTVTQAPYTFGWINVAAGSYTITAKATDNLGGTTTSSASGITVSTNQAPTVGLTAPANNASYILPATISLAANASDSDGSIAKVEFYNGATLLATVTQAPYAFDWTNATAGSYAITAKATDNLGAVTTSAPVNITVSANVPPTVSLTAPADGANYAGPATVILSAAASDSDGSIAKIEFYNGASLLATVTQAPYTYVWNDVAAGNYVITAKATDNLGGEASATAGITVTANQSPSVSISANPTAAVAPAMVTLSATATDTDGSIAKVEFYNGATLLATITQTPYTFTWTNVAAGSYAITAKATDDAGATTISTPVTVSVSGGGVQAYYIYTDQLNTPRLITDQNDHAVWQWDQSDPFGNNVANQDPGNTGISFEFNPRFAGQYFDKETNLHYNSHRDYDPAAGRYIQSDPIGLNGGINTYAYALGNPVSYTDPRGQMSVIDVGGVVIISGGLWACSIAPGCMEGLRDIVRGIDNACQATGDAVRNWFANEGADQGDKGSSSVRDNNKQGTDYEEEIANDLEASGRQVDRQVRKDTPFGDRVIDLEVKDGDGNVLGGVEVKSGNSRYRPDQRSKDEWLRQNGYPVNVVRQR